MRVCLASNNLHKKREIAALLGDTEVILPRDLGIAFSAEETGDTFLANAIIKAQALWAALHSDGYVGPGAEHSNAAVDSDKTERLIVLADDSGLCVDALDGRPGVHSARYGVTMDRPSLSSREQNDLLLAELEGSEDRTAHFVCCVVAIIEQERVLTAQERWDGRIAHGRSSSNGGFGYDPVFYLPESGCTAADLPTERKNEISHRGRAIAVVRAAIDRAYRLSSA
jgi:XTP/dITP diphosphohydrolase